VPEAGSEQEHGCGRAADAVDEDRVHQCGPRSAAVHASCAGAGRCNATSGVIAASPWSVTLRPWWTGGRLR
jgi:hypothetical protein